MKSWYARFVGADDETTATAHNIAPDVAEAFVAATQRNIADRSPRHAATFLDHTATIAQATRVIQAMEELRERSIVAADSTSPNADRKAIGIAAAMPPSRLYRLLEKNGRPRKRRPDAAPPREESVR
jgi:hypothetical protein